MTRRRLWPDDESTALAEEFQRAFESESAEDIVDRYGLLRIPPWGVARSPWIDAANALGTDVLAAVDPDEWRRIWRLWRARRGGGVIVMPPWDDEWSADSEKELIDNLNLSTEQLRSKVDEFLGRS